MKSIIITALVLCSAAFASADDKFGDIGYADLAAAIKDKKVVVIDVNGSASYANGHIPGAIDYQANGKNLAAVLPADKSTLVVAYCGSATCPAWKQGASAVANLGYANVKHFKGGLAGWKEAGGALEKADASSKKGG